MAILDNIAEVKAHNSAITSGIELEDMQSFIDDAANFFIVPTIGQDQYDALVVVRELNPTDVQKRAIELVQKAIVGHMIGSYTDNGSVMISSAGIMVPKSSNSAPASDKKLMQLKRYNLRSAWQAREMLIDHLERYRQIFNWYNESPERGINLGMFINRSVDFQLAGIQINSDAQLFASLRPYQVSAEATYLEPNLGEDITADLRAKILTGILDDKDKRLLKHIQRAVAAFTMSEAITFKSVTIDASGVFQLSETVGGISGNVENRNPPSDAMVQSLSMKYYVKGEMQIENLKKFLKANAADYSYTAPDDVLLNADSSSNIYFL